MAIEDREKGMRFRSLGLTIVASMLVLSIASCGLLVNRLSQTSQMTRLADLPTRVRWCTQSVYDVQYCLGLVPTVPSMYPDLYYSKTRR